MSSVKLVLFDVNVFAIESIIKKVKGKSIKEHKLRKTSHNAIYNNLPIEVYSYVKSNDKKTIARFLKQHFAEQNESLSQDQQYQLQTNRRIR